MERWYGTTWGALVTDSGVRFRLWAPAAKNVSVVTFDGSQRTIPMQPREDGWYEIVTADAAPGTRYMYEIDGGLRVADPASRFQPDGPERPSMVVDPKSFEWPDREFHLRPWNEAVIYELHVGTFTPEGTYAAAAQRLDHVAALGVTAVELMPLSQPPGARNWGYDGVLHYSPAHYYGTPDDLKRFIVAAHDRGLAVVLDVVYNHFGPQGNYLPAYAPQWFSNRIQTPWGAGIDYSSPGNEPVRSYAIENACYWLTEYAFDGLRLDATPAIVDTRPVHVLTEILEEAKRAAARPVYLIAEDVKNEVIPRVKEYDGRWSDDPHDALHVLLTEDTSAYYDAFRARPLERMMGTLAGEQLHLVEFLQNHDQVGNRPFGDRITALASPEAIRAAMAIVLLAPAVPLLFMGEEWGATSPFLFFCDFEPGLAKRVSDGRRAEFSSLAEFAEPSARTKIPDPGAEATFVASRLEWNELQFPQHQAWLEYYRRLLALRREKFSPLYGRIAPAQFEVVDRGGVVASWKLSDNAALTLQANLTAGELHGLESAAPGKTLFATHDRAFASGMAPACSVRWSLSE